MYSVCYRRFLVPINKKMLPSYYTGILGLIKEFLKLWALSRRRQSYKVLQ